MGRRRKAGRQGFNNASPNTIQAAPAIYLKLVYQDPDGVRRPFPVGLPVVVRFGLDQDAIDGVNTVEHAATTTAGGALQFPARVRLGVPWRNFTLRFGAAPAAASPPASSGRYVYVEGPGDPQQPGFTSDAAVITNMQNTIKQRFFLLPHRWSVKSSDWSLGGPIAAGCTFDPATGQFRQTAKKVSNIASQAAPIELVLNPHWQFLRFEYFDRYYGPTSGSPPRAGGHGRRVSTPPLILEGFRFDANAGGDKPETRSNWTVDDPGLAGDRLQCIPLILRKNLDGSALPEMRGSSVGVRFVFGGDPAWVYSSAANAREIRIVAANSPPVAQPSADRLKYYDLPPIWKSRGYYTRKVASSPPAPGDFFHTLSPPRFTDAETKAKPLIFCLDDMVLSDGSPPAGPVTALSPPASLSPLAIFNHRFDNSIAGSTTHGIYDPQPHAGAASSEYLPRSRTPVDSNYISEYPDWTRMVAMNGDLFDVFDRRTPDSSPPPPIPSPPPVVGARAAVRWVDSISPPGAMVVAEWSPPLAGWAAPADSRALPRRRVDGVPPRVDTPYFNIQPFFQQFPPQWQQPYTGAVWQQGRFDIGLVRCCDYDGANELATNIHYLKSFFDFGGVASPPADQRTYANEASMNTANRWNGPDTVSTGRAIITPSPPALLPLQTQVVWFAQSTPFERAHFEVTMVGPGGRDNRWAQGGRGESSITGHVPEPSQWFPLAHESGHMNGQPDEYNERWNAFSYGQLSFKANLPGDPYEPDGRNDAGLLADTGMMNGNRRIRNRYFWHAAEWIRDIAGQPMRVQYRDLGGTFYDDYWLPRHPNAANQQTYYIAPVFARRDVPAGHPWTQTDFFLYALGKDHYSSDPILMPHASLAAPYDGILVIGVRFSCTLFGSAALNTEVDRRESILSDFAGAVRRGMNFRFAATGATGSPPVNFSKCLIHFAPQFVVRNYPNSAPLRAPVVAGGRQYVDADNTADATQVRTDFGFNYRLNVAIGGPNAAWNLGNFELNMDLTNLNQVDNFTDTHFPRVLNVGGNMAAVTPADVEAVVQAVLPGWVVRNLP